MSIVLIKLNVSVQEDLKQFQEFERLLQSLETQLQRWERKQQMDSLHTDISEVINICMQNAQ